MKRALVLVGGLLMLCGTIQVQEDPIRIGVVGLVQGDVGSILLSSSRPDVEVVAVVETNSELVTRFSERFGFDRSIVYESIDKMATAVEVDAIAVFSTIKDRLAVTRVAACHGIHVMLEKPMAISLDHARQMAAVADSAGIHLLVNYETSRYPSVHYAHAMRDKLGPLRKIVVRLGHEGPKEVGVGPEFLEWLTDPEKSGAGALMDFGCYGANLITWLLDGARPQSVTAVVQTIKPDIYPRVDDEATIIVTYPETQDIIQASWNWPFGRNDMSVYGKVGYLHADNARDMRVRLPGESAERQETTAQILMPSRDPLTYLIQVLNGNIDPAGGLYFVDINVVAMEILDAAMESVRLGATVYLSEE